LEDQPKKTTDLGKASVLPRKIWSQEFWQSYGDLFPRVLSLIKCIMWHVILYWMEKASGA